VSLHHYSWGTLTLEHVSPDIYLKDSAWDGFPLILGLKLLGPHSCALLIEPGYSDGLVLFDRVQLLYKKNDVS
jgi:hypothetical protein